MNMKSLLVLVVALVVLCGLYLVVPSKRPQIGTSSEIKGKVPFDGFDKSKALAFTLARGDVNLRIERSGLDEKGNPVWVLAENKRKVKSDRVDTLLDKIGKAKVASVRPGDLARFDLDDKNRTVIDVLGESDKSIAKMIVGKSPEWSTCFALHTDNQTVVELSENFDNSVGIETVGEGRELKPSWWYDLQITKFDRDDVIEIAIHKDGQYTRMRKFVDGKPLEPQAAKSEEDKKQEDGDNKDKNADKKAEPDWRIVEPLEADGDDITINGMCSSAASLYAKGYADDVKPEELGLDQPTAKTEILLKDGRKFSLTFGKVADDFVVLRLNEHQDIWKIEKYNFESLTKDLEKLKKEEPKKEEQKATTDASADEIEAESPSEAKPAPKAPEIPTEVKKEAIPLPPGTTPQEIKKATE